MKQLFQIGFQGEEVLGVLATCHGRKIDQHIQVAAWSSGSRSRRPEQLEPPHMMTVTKRHDLWSQGLDFLDHTDILDADAQLFQHPASGC